MKPLYWSFIPIAWVLGCLHKPTPYDGWIAIGFFVMFIFTVVYGVFIKSWNCGKSTTRSSCAKYGTANGRELADAGFRSANGHKE
jgi:hypothetical protein